MTSSRVDFISNHFSFNYTTKPDDFTASYKFWSLKHFLSRGDFKPSNEANELYLRPAKQYESIPR